MKYFISLIDDLKKGRIAPVYLFFGPEGYLRKEAVNKIRDLLLSEGANDINYTVVDGEENSLPDIINLANMTPLFAEKRVVLVKNAKFFSEAQQISPSVEIAFLNYLRSPATSTCLIFETGNNIDKRRKIYKQFTQAGKVIEFNLLKSNELTLWLEKQARIAGKSLMPGLAAEILSRTGNSLQSILVEIQKLITYAGENKVITAEDVLAVTPPYPEEDVFAVVDAIGGKNPARAVEGVKRLFLQRQPPPVILGMITRQIRLILRTGEAIRSGKHAGNLASYLGVHPFVAKKMASQQKNFSRSQLIKTLHRLHALDIAVKTGQQEFLAGIEMLILDICMLKNSVSHSSI